MEKIHQGPISALFEIFSCLKLVLNLTLPEEISTKSIFGGCVPGGTYAHYYNGGEGRTILLLIKSVLNS